MGKSKIVIGINWKHLIECHKESGDINKLYVLADELRKLYEGTESKLNEVRDYIDNGIRAHRLNLASLDNKSIIYKDEQNKIKHIAGINILQNIREKTFGERLGNGE